MHCVYRIKGTFPYQHFYVVFFFSLLFISFILSEKYLYALYTFLLILFPFFIFFYIRRSVQQHHGIWQWNGNIPLNQQYFCFSFLSIIIIIFTILPALFFVQLKIMFKCWIIIYQTIVCIALSSSYRRTFKWKMEKENYNKILKNLQ